MGDLEVLGKKLETCEFDPVTKTTVKQLVERTRSLATKDTLNKYYRGQIEGLSNQVEVLIEERRKLLAENADLQKQLDKLLYSGGGRREGSSLSPVPRIEVLSLQLPLSAVGTPRRLDRSPSIRHRDAAMSERATTERTRRCAMSLAQTVRRNTIQTAVLDAVTPLLHSLLFINKSADFSNVCAHHDPVAERDDRGKLQADGEL